MYDKDEQYFHLPVIGEFIIEIKKEKRTHVFPLDFSLCQYKLARKFMRDHGIEIIDKRLKTYHWEKYSERTNELSALT
jgi:hypothetical protein